jgi:DNA-binding GntR family transcriptional regulator
MATPGPARPPPVWLLNRLEYPNPPCNRRCKMSRTLGSGPANRRRNDDIYFIRLRASKPLTMNKKIDLQIAKQPATLRLIVEGRLRMAISAGDFKPGQRLIERELCELTGVGRTSIREALRQLEAEGLITNIPHRGPTVSTISSEEARQLYALRGLLEGYAGRCCAERRSPQSCAALAEAVSQFEHATRPRNQQKLIEAKSRFYELLMDGSGNVFIKQVLTVLHNRITLLRLTSMTQPGRLKRSTAEIREILAAVEAGDGDRAEIACKIHVENAAAVALAYLDARAMDAA